MSSRRARPGGMLATVGTTAAAKILVVGLSGVLGILTGRLIIANFGTDAYAQYGLLTTLPALLPFADMGIAAVVINAVSGSDSVRTDAYVRRVIVTAFRILLVSGTLIVAAAVGFYLLGWWPILLGAGLLPDGGSLAAAACLAVFGLVLPLTVGQRLLVGLRKTSAQVASQSIIAPFMLLSIALLIAFSVPAGTYISVLSYIASGLVSAVCLLMASRALAPQVGRAIREIPRLRSVRSVPALGLAWPMLVQMLAMPLSMQTGRLLLAHLSTSHELATYNLASQLFGIVLQTIAAAGVALWPIYARARSTGSVESPLAPTLWFLLGGLTLGTILALASPWVAGFVSSGKIVLDPLLLVMFVVFVGLQAAKYPFGMYMTDRKGLRFQVIPVIVMVPISLGLSFMLIPLWGAAGAVAGASAAVLICQIFPNLWYVYRDLALRRATAAQDVASEAPLSGDSVR
ncbi:polysaccharide biosynthesis protein [Cryobacterium sp. MLB-32]|nr:polysaccharide biosynthesis protein [Cryobacterium sp. MLB-32]